jgi:coproporphyrinogen III oxidase-like Fe-S oxidoreductase
MIDYDLPLWRPPSEGDNLIIQASIGCSFNHCTFCSMYRSKDYRARPLEDVQADIDQAAKDWPHATRVFLADGDAWGLPTETLLAICAHLKLRFPALQRVSAYATPFNLIRKSAEELQSLRQAGMGLAYVGIESGSDLLLKKITKGSAAQMEAGLLRAIEGGIKVSATVINGLGGKTHWREHVEATAAMVSRAPPTYLSTLQLVLTDETAPIYFERFKENFIPQDDVGILGELALLIDRIAPPKPIIFRSNHASNALALAGNLPKDKASLLEQIQLAATGEQALRPSWLRGL